MLLDSSPKTTCYWEGGGHKHVTVVGLIPAHLPGAPWLQINGTEPTAIVPTFNLMRHDSLGVSCSRAVLYGSLV
jgi:hypothetical protein